MKWQDWGERQLKKGYAIDTWADGYGIWHAQAVFGSGVGNTPEAEQLKHKALANLKRAIRKEIMDREAPKQVRRLAYEVSANYIDAQNRMWSITVREKVDD
jgi:hypothetical protein